MAAKALEADFDKWQKAHGAKSDLVWLEMSEKGRTINFLLEGMDEFTLRFPEVYPPQNDSHRFNWATEVNKMLATGTPMLVGDILTRSLALKKELQNKKSDKKAPKAEVDDEIIDDDDGGAAEEGGADFDLESEELKESLEILRMKKRWAKKEAALREDMRKKRDKEVKSKDKQKVEQIFSTQAASGVLTNDLLSIMEQSDTLGFRATPIDDNIYHWNAHLFKFQPDSEIGRQLKELKKLYGYDYVELEIHFTIDLYPFYPPQVKVVRPRFQGFMMGRITSMELLKLSYWDPVKDMKHVLNSIRALIQEHGKIDVNNPVNNPKEHPKGAYSELEYLLLRLELLSEQDPRANLKYPVQVQQVAKTSAKKNDKPAEFWAKGTGYGHQGQSTWDVQAYLAAQREKDMQTEHVLKSVLDQLSSTKVTPAQYEVLEESCLLPVLEGFLRNDSLLDISKHAPLYLVIFGLIRALVANEVTVPLVDKLAFQKESVHELLRVLHTQANIFLKRVTAQTGGPQATALAEDIVKTFSAAETAVQKFRADMSSLEQAVSGNAAAQRGAVDFSDPKKLAEAYMRALRPLQFDMCNMRSGSTYKHHYANKLSGGHASKEKVLRLAQEQSALSTSLPLNMESSVFLRVDEERMDLMQAIITGPIDTPYSGGCFLFDVFFPDTYPQGPPLVNLMTTGGGSVRFNPNLYNCGKVCLSLLGTWSGAEGENWNRDTSTFLQVLVSIQSLILVPKPFFNEPGFERQMGTPQGDESNRKYNEVIRVATIEFAMIGQLRNPPAGFEEVVRTHFYLKANFIRQQCDQWLQEGKGSNAHYARLLKLTKELKDELDKLPKPASLK